MHESNVHCSVPAIKTRSFGYRKQGIKLLDLDRLVCESRSKITCRWKKSGCTPTPALQHTVELMEKENAITHDEKRLVGNATMSKTYNEEKVKVYAEKRRQVGTVYPYCLIKECSSRQKRV